MTCGVPQGSILGPTLWNIFYDQILRTDTGLGNTILAYADDLALLITASTYTILEEKIQTAALAIKNKKRQKKLSWSFSLDNARQKI